MVTTERFPVRLVSLLLLQSSTHPKAEEGFHNPLKQGFSLLWVRCEPCGQIRKQCVSGLGLVAVAPSILCQY